MPVCGDCGGTVIEYDAAAGNGFCVKCGTVIEENTIVSEVTFGETSNGAAMVQGAYVGQGSTHARMGGPFGNRGSSESREQTIANASKKIRSVANVLRLSEVVSLAAVRMYTLAVEHKFTKGRKNMNVVAVCLYVACRQKETRNYMLIDFSDLLQVNVFELGHTYLQLVQTLNLRLPLVDPSHYIGRFAALLEFGDETPKVATDAVRLVQRFDRDWMTKGRRPAGICGACLLLAARMNNFRRSTQEIVQVVKIADTTLKKRLDEFKKTPSGSLTLADFRTVWLEEEMDPPAFAKGKERDERDEAEDADEEGDGGVKPKKKVTKKKRKKRKRGQEEEVEGQVALDGLQAPLVPPRPQAIDPDLLNQGILAGALTTSTPLFLPEHDNLRPPTQVEENANIDPSLLSNSCQPTHPTPGNHNHANATDNPKPLTPPPISPFEETANTILTEEVSDFLTNLQGSSLAGALDEAEQRRQSQFTVVDELLGLDEEELDRFILSEEEVKIRERVWVEINRDYLEALAARGEPKSQGDQPKSRKRRKTNKPRDASTPHGTTTAESVRNLIKKNPRYSKRINYDALKDLFVDGDGEPGVGQSLDDRRLGEATSDFSALVPPNIDLDEKDDDDLYRMDDKSDGEGMLVIEEEGGGGVGQLKPPVKSNGTVVSHDRGHADGDGLELGDDDAEGEEDVEVEMSEKGDTDYAWDEGYEQEV